MDFIKLILENIGSNFLSMISVYFVAFFVAFATFSLAMSVVKHN